MFQKSIRAPEAGMQGYVTLDTRDLPRAVKFYDRIARELGSRRSLESDGCVAWGIPGAPAAISVEAPAGRVAACGTGVVALQASDPEQVQRLYELAIAQGGRGEAEPCERGGFYAAYFRDPDGNRLNAFCMSEH